MTRKTLMIVFLCVGILLLGALIMILVGHFTPANSNLFVPILLIVLAAGGYAAHKVEVYAKSKTTVAPVNNIQVQAPVTDNSIDLLKETNDIIDEGLLRNNLVKAAVIQKSNPKKPRAPRKPKDT